MEWLLWYGGGGGGTVFPRLIGKRYRLSNQTRVKERKKRRKRENKKPFDLSNGLASFVCFHIEMYMYTHMDIPSVHSNAVHLQGISGNLHISSIFCFYDRKKNEASLNHECLEFLHKCRWKYFHAWSWRFSWKIPFWPQKNDVIHVMKLWLKLAQMESPCKNSGGNRFQNKVAHFPLATDELRDRAMQCRKNPYHVRNGDTFSIRARVSKTCGMKRP